MNGKIFEYDKDMKDYIHNLDNDGLASETILYNIMDSHFIKEFINTEVEILEDNTEEIEEIQEISDEYFNMLSDEAKVKWLKSYIKEDRNKINELVKVVKEIRKDLNK